MHTRLRISLTVSGSAAALLLTACSSTGFGPLTRSASDNSPVAETADKALEQIAETRAMVDAVARATDDLLNRPSPNLSRQYKEFAQMVERFDDSFDDLRNVTADLESRSQEYFIAWDKEIATMRDDEIRRSSADRRAEVQRNYDELRSQYADTRPRVEAFLRRVRDIESALGKDLTTAGVDAVRPTVENFTNEAGQINESLNELSREFREFGIAMAPANTMTEQPR